MVNAQCKKARNSYYNKNIADVQQSNPKQWWSAVKRIASLSTPKMPKTLIYDCTYQGEDLANLFNDKFVAVGSSLPPHNVDTLTSIRPNSSYPSRKQKQHYFHANSILPLVPMKYQRGFFARTHLFCVVHYAPFSIRLFVKASFLPCGNQPTFYQFQNLLPPPTSIPTFVLFHLPVFSVKSWNLSLPLASCVSFKPNRSPPVRFSTRIKRKHGSRPPPA